MIDHEDTLDTEITHVYPLSESGRHVLLGFPLLSCLCGVEVEVHEVGTIVVHQRTQ